MKSAPATRSPTKATGRLKRLEKEKDARDMGTVMVYVLSLLSLPKTEWRIAYSIQHLTITRLTSHAPCLIEVGPFSVSVERETALPPTRGTPPLPGGRADPCASDRDSIARSALCPGPAQWRTAASSDARWRETAQDERKAASSGAGAVPAGPAVPRGLPGARWPDSVGTVGLWV